MRQFVKNLSDRTEFIIVTVLSFSCVMMSSLGLLLSGGRYVEFTTGGVLGVILIEVFTLGVVLSFLRARGWNIRHRLGLDFSWKAAAAGIPLFVIYLLLYWVTATLVLLVFPKARAIGAFNFTTLAPFVLMLFFIVINAVFEELTVTAYVIESMAGGGAGRAITASTLLRFSYYLWQGPLASLSMVPLGLLFGAMYWRRRNVWPLIAAHTIANAVVFALK